ncbi:CMRF35-like molecule 1 isoform X2 [Myxocyprinus asiaticus]|uniref:CMRF35-like molecule 1 isoform X2 n=1 Tax=Myxocyprinus asiaticus TaxID=70543 RepID=UPI002222595B|nr:CMRF35-like molecule 1 isoform X2 [Myxocyprinus asiaticus]
MVTYGKLSIFYSLICFYLILGFNYSNASSNTIPVQTEGSVTIPCHYDSKYTQQRKYWYSEWNRSYIYTNTTKENLSVIDYPDQSLFTVTLRNLQNKHNGLCYFLVETGGSTALSYLQFYLQIKSVPDLSVVSSSVTGQEGGNISVQCLYSSEYKNKLKQWCRYKDKRCSVVGKTDTSQNPSVQISDDGREFFTVVMTGLTESDSGWYSGHVGNLLVPVQIIVTKKKTVTVTTDISPEKDTYNKSLSVWLSTSAAVLLILILICAFTWRWRKRHNKEEYEKQIIIERNSAKTTDRVSRTPKDPVIFSTINYDNIKISSSLEPSTDITYSTIAIAPVNLLNSHCPADGVIYSTVAQH